MRLVGSSILNIWAKTIKFEHPGLASHVKPLGHQLHVLTDCHQLSEEALHAMFGFVHIKPFEGSGAEAPIAALHLMFGKDFVNHLPGAHV